MAGGDGRQRAAGTEGSDRCEVGFRGAGTGRKAERENKEGERGDLRLGASCSVLPSTNRGASGKRPTLPLPIPIIQALLLCF